MYRIDRQAQRYHFTSDWLSAYWHFSFDHYYDPELYPAGVGTFCMLQTLELARRLEKRWAYFGFYVAGCGSLAYKARFKPCEIMGADGAWKSVET